MPGSIINLTDEAVQRNQGFGSLDKSAERKDLAPEVDVHQPDYLQRAGTRPEADVYRRSVGRRAGWPPRILGGDLGPEHRVDAFGKPLRLVAIHKMEVSGSQSALNGGGDPLRQRCLALRDRTEQVVNRWDQVVLLPVAHGLQA